MSEQKPAMTEKQRMWKLAGQYSSVGGEMAICVGLSGWLGTVADEKFGTDPGFALFGFVVGVGAAAKAVEQGHQFGHRRHLDFERYNRTNYTTY